MTKWGRHWHGLHGSGMTSRAEGPREGPTETPSGQPLIPSGPSSLMVCLDWQNIPGFPLSWRAHPCLLLTFSLGVLPGSILGPPPCRPSLLWAFTCQLCAEEPHPLLDRRPECPTAQQTSPPGSQVTIACAIPLILLFLTPTSNPSEYSDHFLASTLRHHHPPGLPGPAPPRCKQCGGSLSTGIMAHHCSRHSRCSPLHLNKTQRS